MAPSSPGLLPRPRRPGRRLSAQTACRWLVVQTRLADPAAASSGDPTGASSMRTGPVSYGHMREPMAHESTARRGAGRPTKAVQRQRATGGGGARGGTATAATATLGNERRNAALFCCLGFGLAGWCALWAWRRAPAVRSNRARRQIFSHCEW